MGERGGIQLCAVNLFRQPRDTVVREFPNLVASGGEGGIEIFEEEVCYLWPEGRSPRVGTPSGVIRENGTSLRPLSRPPCFPAPLKMEHPSLMPLKSHPGVLRAFPGL